MAKYVGRIERSWKKSIPILTFFLVTKKLLSHTNTFFSGNGILREWK